MFDELYTDGRCRDRQEVAPMRSERLQYLTHLAKEGRASSTLRMIADHLVCAAEILQLGPQERVTEARLQQIRLPWRETHPPLRPSKRFVRPHETCFMGTVRRWLRFMGQLEPEQLEEPFADVLESFIQSNRADRDLAEATLARYRRTVSPFLRWCSRRAGAQLSCLKAADLQDYLQEPHCKNWSRSTIATHVGAIRVFLRWLEQRGLVPPGLPDCIRAPRLYTHERYPVGPSWPQVRELIDSVPTDTQAGRRDRALLLLMAVHGFRGNEVRSLRLDDIDWEHEVIRPTRSKERRVGLYPLSRTVGDAIIAYLKVRPTCRRREVFLTLRQPYRPLSDGGLSAMVRNRQKRLGHTPRYYGPHGLRHACATHLLAQGHSMKEIGDHLGHSVIRATEIYAKVDLPALTEVGEVELSGLVDYEQELARSETPFFEPGDLGALRLVGELSLEGLV